MFLVSKLTHQKPLCRMKPYKGSNASSAKIPQSHSHAKETRGSRRVVGRTSSTGSWEGGVRWAASTLHGAAGSHLAQAHMWPWACTHPRFTLPPVLHGGKCSESSDTRKDPCERQLHSKTSKTTEKRKPSNTSGQSQQLPVAPRQPSPSLAAPCRAVPRSLPR